MTSNVPGDLVSETQNNSDGYVPGNHWATPYQSNHTHLTGSKEALRLLEHVNCTYLSTPGRPPTLLALKQHAQSLAVLISMINPSSAAGEIDNENKNKDTDTDKDKDGDTAMGAATLRAFKKNEAFDWLNNLLAHYDSIDQDHHRPLNSLANLIRQNSDIEGVEYHCPLDALPLVYAEANKEAQYRPFENHLMLLMHANECLERLDHEYSAMGGLLALVPSDSDASAEHAALAAAKETLVGQWLLHTQHLTSRMHELEIAYANCLDLLANEALVPAQHNSVHGPDGRSGREIVFPQDRWVLANAGEDVFAFIHQMLDKKEAALERVDRAHASRGVVGERLMGPHADDRTRGIVHLDFSTRFYRLKGSGHGPLFVLPAYGDRPSTQYTRDMEGRPTVVTVPTPGFPGRTSVWDAKNRDKDRVVAAQFTELATSNQNVRALTDRLARQTDETDRQRAINNVWQDSVTNGQTITDRIRQLTSEKDVAESTVTDLTLRVRVLERQLAQYKTDTAAYYASLGKTPPSGSSSTIQPPPPTV
ncbi:hypothetical protein SLS62_007687 [Diatrype stigma]|uniref:Uncharacterized protein n=1 Tax=Diatrype stigma TaxID=117547 RepID=A0AAN9UMU1_9PEZI